MHWVYVCERLSSTRLCGKYLQRQVFRILLWLMTLCFDSTHSPRQWTLTWSSVAWPTSLPAPKYQRKTQWLVQWVHFSHFFLLCATSHCVPFFNSSGRQRLSKQSAAGSKRSPVTLRFHSFYTRCCSVFRFYFWSVKSYSIHKTLGQFLFWVKRF